MRKFHPLTVADLRHETADSMRLALQVPADVREAFDFLPGQHLPIRIDVGGKAVRRTYSICSAPGDDRLELGIRIQPGGIFSGYVAGQLNVGDVLQVMPPFGQFHATIDPDSRRNHLALAAGSGITPILSIIRATLAEEPHSRFLVFYGNRRQNTTMFIDDLYALKNRYPERLQLQFLFTREEQEYPLLSGRLDAAKVAELYALFCNDAVPDEVFVCGPDTMIETAHAALGDLGVADPVIHVEHYGAPRRPSAAPPAATTDDHDCNVTVIQDGHRKSFQMSAAGASIVDAAAEQGIDLPFSCKGGVCATCRTHVREGEVRMETNYGLEPWEVEQGFVLACQSHPISDRVVLDYDRI